ncbi:RNA methyltransferase [Clostridium sp. AF18-27]|uniref:TrmH family RNA methyltransferase n=1 Tax=Enterocloster lavalensis TaxID=460384 RepID=UPI000E4C41DD|nr:RNA methyltransferase [Enterocloster lavalensis]RHR54569.1 RNA methyltransferase [Clostridium sp. AF18-27]
MIGSTSNKQVKRVVNLRAKAKARREENCYVAEGLRMCRELSPDQVEMLYVTEEFGSVPGNRRWLAGFPHETVSDVVMNYMADTKTPQGVLAVVKQRHYRLEELLPQAGKQALKTSAPSGKNPPAPACLMILETLQDPGNLGTILRAGEGAGITGLVMNRDTADIYNPKVIRSTMGSILRVPFVYVDDLGAALAQIKSAGVRLFAAHLKGTNNYDQEDYTGNIGFLIGNEAAGLTEEAAAMADCYIKIPMAGQVESLNAAVASSVLMFEAARQRRNSSQR